MLMLLSIFLTQAPGQSFQSSSISTPPTEPRIKGHFHGAFKRI